MLSATHQARTKLRPLDSVGAAAMRYCRPSRSFRILICCYRIPHDHSPRQSCAPDPRRDLSSQVEFPLGAHIFRPRRGSRVFTVYTGPWNIAFFYLFPDRRTVGRFVGSLASRSRCALNLAWGDWNNKRCPSCAKRQAQLNASPKTDY